MKMDRYAAYFRLLDAAIVCQLLMIGAAVFKAATGTSMVGGVLRYPFVVVAMIAVILPLLLIFQRWMRDDFSQMLWQRTAGTVMKALALMPIPAILLVAYAAVTMGVGTDVGDDAFGGDPAVTNFIDGAVRSLLLLWLMLPLSFTFAFQWHRWRAGR
jgi:hypothetical protein